MKAIGILGLGTYVPEEIVTTRQLRDKYQISKDGVLKKVAELFKTTGINERRYVADEQNTSDLAFGASVRALDNASIGLEKIDMVILTSSSPESIFPATACRLLRKLNALFGSENRCRAYDESAACSGFVYGLESAYNAILSGRYQNVLVVGAEVVTRELMFSAEGNWWQTFTLFGDGAGAAVVGPVKEGYGFLDFYTRTDSSLSELARSDGLGTRLADIGIAPQMYLNGPAVFKAAVRTMSEAIEKICEQCSVAVADIDWLVLHQANKRITEGVAVELGLATKEMIELGLLPEKMINEIVNFGNTSTASIPLALEQAILKGQIKDGDLIALAAAGAGMTYGACLLRWGR